MTVILSTVIASLLLLIGIPMVLISVQIQRRDSDRSQQQMATHLAQSVSDLVRGVQSGQGISTNDPNLDLVAHQISTELNNLTAQIVRILQSEQNSTSMLKALPLMQGVVIFATDGTVEQSQWRSPQSAINPTILTQSESFALAQQGTIGYEITDFDTRVSPALIVAVPTHTSGSVAVAWFDTASLWQYFTQLNVSDTGYLYLIDSQNNAIIVPEQFAQHQASAIDINAILAKQRYKGLNGKDVVGHLASVEGTPWRVVVEIPLAEANASLKSLLVILGAILLFGLSLAMTVARIFSGWILQPIKTLHQSAERISRGDLSHRIVLDRDDELGFLATAFNQMVETLEKAIDDLRTLSRRLLSAEEAERKRIAHEIHDELGQILVMLRFSLSMAERNSPNNPTIKAVQEMAAQAQEKARTLSHELRPAMLDDIGLLPTLQWYIDRVEQRANLAIRLDVSVDEASLPPEIKITLYRLVVEALSNVSKHAEASAVEISLRRNKMHLILKIEDDGIGFDTEILAQSVSLGISGMRERVNLLQGDFSINSQLGQGTDIKITLPF